MINLLFIKCDKLMVSVSLSTLVLLMLTPPPAIIFLASLFDGNMFVFSTKKSTILMAFSKSDFAIENCGTPSKISRNNNILTGSASQLVATRNMIRNFGSKDEFLHIRH